MINHSNVHSPSGHEENLSPTGHILSPTTLTSPTATTTTKVTPKNDKIDNEIILLEKNLQELNKKIEEATAQKRKQKVKELDKIKKNMETELEKLHATKKRNYN